MEQKTPKKIKAYAIVNKDDIKLHPMMVFADKDVVVFKKELLCEVEINFIKYVGK